MPQRHLFWEEGDGRVQNQRVRWPSATTRVTFLSSCTILPTGLKGLQFCPVTLWEVGGKVDRSKASEESVVLLRKGGNESTAPGDVTSGYVPGSKMAPADRPNEAIVPGACSLISRTQSVSDESYTPPSFKNCITLCFLLPH